MPWDTRQPSRTACRYVCVSDMYLYMNVFAYFVYIKFCLLRFVFIRIQAKQLLEHVQHTFVKSLQRKVNATIAVTSRFPFTDFMVYPLGPAFGGLLVCDHYYRRPCFVWMMELACSRHFPGRLHCPVCKSSRGIKRKEWCSRCAILRDGPCDITCFVYKCIVCKEQRGQAEGITVFERSRIV